MGSEMCIRDSTEVVVALCMADTMDSRGHGCWWCGEDFEAVDRAWGGGGGFFAFLASEGAIVVDQTARVSKGA